MVNQMEGLLEGLLLSKMTVPERMCYKHIVLAFCSLKDSADRRVADDLFLNVLFHYNIFGERGAKRFIIDYSKDAIRRSNGKTPKAALYALKSLESVGYAKLLPAVGEVLQ